MTGGSVYGNACQIADIACCGFYVLANTLAITPDCYVQVLTASGVDVTMPFAKDTRFFSSSRASRSSIADEIL